MTVTSNVQITLPIGKYYITAIAPNYYSGTFPLSNACLLLSEYSKNSETYTDIAFGTPAFPGGVSHLQTVYQPTVDTIVSVRVSYTDISTSLDTFGNTNRTATVSIVKFW
jgi:hypothetical protein